MTKKFNRTLVTCALPYANGPVHIGHLAGVYVPADIYVRYLRMRGEDVLYVCGSDEHGVPITIKAQKEGCTPQDIVDRYHKIIKDSFTGLGINFDIYSRTSSKTHHKNAADYFRKLYDEGKFIEKVSEQYYDEETKTFLADRYITGTCPRCGAVRLLEQLEGCVSPLYGPELRRKAAILRGRCGSFTDIPEDDALLLKAEHALADGRPEDTVRYLLARDDRGQQWHRLMAESLFHSGDYAGARDHYLQCPQTSDIFSRLEICCRELGDYRMAYHYAKLQ